MTIQFGPGITGNRRGEVQIFIEKKVDRDTDIYLATVSERPGNYAYMRVWWHKSDADKELHLTGDVFWVSHPKLASAGEEAYIACRTTSRSERRMFTRTVKSRCSHRARIDFAFRRTQCPPSVFESS
jgi:hypothetical protein